MKPKQLPQIIGLALAAGSLFLAPAVLANDDPWVRISEIRIDEPGTDVNEYFELEGTPGYSLDGYWYLVLGDHSNFNNPDPDPPDYRSGVVEFAMDLSLYTIPDSGFFLVVTTVFDLLPLSAVLAGGGEVIANLEFENNDNVTHLLVRGYKGPEVLQMADQYGPFAVNLDLDNDGSLIDPLPWDETIDAIGLIAVPNEQVDIDAGDEFVYGALLGFTDIGPDGFFVPSHVYRGRNDGRWNIGTFGLDGETDTPGGPNLDSPLNPVITRVSSTVVEIDERLSVFGRNFTAVTDVEIGSQPVLFEIVSDEEITVLSVSDITGGYVTLRSPEGVTSSDEFIRVGVGSGFLLFREDFEDGLGDFSVVSLASENDWFHRVFRGESFAQINGFGADEPSNDWLISPRINLANADSPILEFLTARNFAGPSMQVYVSTDYDVGDPTESTWILLSPNLSEGEYRITPSGALDLTPWVGEEIRVGFHYTSDGGGPNEAALYQVHEVTITLLSNPDEFESGWVDHPELGETYLFSPSWAFHPMVGYVHVLLYPWMDHPELGWVYHAGGHPDTGAWFYSVVVDEYVWSRVDLGGVFYFEDGTTGLFFE